MFHVTQFSTLAKDADNKPMPVGMETGAVKEQRLNEPGVSEPFERSTKLVLLYSDRLCYIRFVMDEADEVTVEEGRPFGPGYHDCGVTAGQRVAVIWE